MSTPATPPQAERRAHTSHHHGIELSDPYHWLRDPGYPEVSDADILDYLKAENRYFDARMAPLEGLVQTLFAELKGRQPQEDASVPYRRRGHLIQWRFAAGAQYRTWWRWPEGRPEEATLLLDEPALAAGCEYFRLGGLTLSPDGRYLAYATDTDGSERYTLRVRELATGEEPGRGHRRHRRRNRLGGRQPHAAVHTAVRAMAPLRGRAPYAWRTRARWQ